MKHSEVYNMTLADIMTGETFFFSKTDGFPLYIMFLSNNVMLQTEQLLYKHLLLLGH